MTQTAKPSVRHPRLRQNKLGLTQRGLRGDPIDSLCWVRARFRYRGDRSGVFRARHTASPCRQAEWDRMLVEDAHVLSQRGPRLQLPAWSYAVHRDGRERGERRPVLHRGFRRRRFALHRVGGVLPRNAPQREHALRVGEQRCVRTDQRSVLGVGGCGQHGETR